MDTPKIGTVDGDRIWTGHNWVKRTEEMEKFLTKYADQLAALNAGGTAEFDVDDVITHKPR